MADIKREHLICAAALAVAGGFAFLAVRKAGGTGEVPGTTESMYGAPTPNAPVLIEEQHETPVIFTAHRYPRSCGQEVTTLLHYGFTQASIPATPESMWMTRPPSELVL